MRCGASSWPQEAPTPTGQANRLPRAPALLRDLAGAGGGRERLRKRLLGHIEGDVTEEHYIERDLAMLREAVCRIRLELSEKGKVIFATFPGAKAAGDSENRDT